VNDSRGKQQLVVVAVASSEPEAEIIRQRLEQAGIWSIAQRTIGGPEWGASGSRYVYVGSSDEADARRVLAEQDSPDSPVD
jgi:hypothetical protein